MGLIKALMGATGGVLADQWREYFYCDAIPSDILMTKGVKRTSKRSSNTKGVENIITNGSIVAVADGQCMLIVDQGRVVDVCAEPGEFVYDSSTEPSVFYGKLSETVPAVLKNIGKRFTFGGEAPKDQRVYFFNTKELIGNKYGTPSPVPFRVIDTNIGLDMLVDISCFGEYSYRIVNPVLFYTNVCANVTDCYERSNIEGQMKTELLTALQPAFARLAEQGIAYSSLPGHTAELADFLNEELSKKWRDTRGIEIVSFGVSSVKAKDEQIDQIRELQRNAVLRDPGMAAAHLAGATAAAMQSAAKNENGAAMAFMGMNMAGAAGGVNANELFRQSQEQAAKRQAQAKPTAAEWKCSCGAVMTGKFCTECGAKKPENGWVCSCGAVNKGRFCSECGAKKPAGVPQYKCDKCGWEPSDPTRPPRFCPECGDPFDNGDII